MSQINNFLNRLKKHIKEIGVRAAYNTPNGVLIDIRERDELQSGSPKSALRISKGLLEMQIYHHIKTTDDPIYLICASGRRSLLAAHNLKQLGFSNVYSVKGGFKEWKNQSLPFELLKPLSADDRERYKRHILMPEVGEDGQQKLLKSKALIVGAGGIGSPIALYLAAAGVGTIGIIDDDIVDRTNLQRQILHMENTVGKPKVDSAKAHLQAFNSSINIKTYEERLTRDNAEEILSEYDVVLDGTDNFNTRYLINDACVKLGIPNVHGSVFKFEGQFTTFWPDSDQENSPCYRCLYPSPPPAELAPSCSEAGVFGVLPGMIGLLCATEAIKILVGFGDLMIGRLFVYNAETWEFNIYEVQQNEDCPYCKCSDQADYPEYIDYMAACSL